MAWPPTTADLKDYLVIARDNTDRDTLLDMARDAARARVETYCQRKFDTSSRTYYLDGTGTTLLPLPDYPITVITTIHEDTEYPRSWDTADLVSSDYYQIINNSSSQRDEDKHSIQRIEGGVWERGVQNIKVVATTGYSTIPSDLYFGTIELAAFIFLRAENKRVGLTSKSESGGSVGYDMEFSAIPKAIRDLIDPYRSFRSFGL